MRADGQVDAPSGARELVGDLYTGRACTYYQNSPVTQLSGIVVVRGMELLDPRIGGNDSGYDRTLKRTRSDDDIGSLNDTFRCFSAKSGPVRAF